MKSTMTKILVAGIMTGSLLATSAFAATNPAPANVTTGVKMSAKTTAGVGGYNYCQYNASDVCINNNTQGNISFNVTFMSPYVPSPPPVAGPIYPNAGADIWASYYYPSEQVYIWDMYGNLIFNQPVPTFSIINVNPYAGTAGAGATNKFTVTVTR